LSSWSQRKLPAHGEERAAAKYLRALLLLGSQRMQAAAIFASQGTPTARGQRSSETNRASRSRPRARKATATRGMLSSQKGNIRKRLCAKPIEHNRQGPDYDPSPRPAGSSYLGKRGASFPFPRHRRPTLTHGSSSSTLNFMLQRF
jgi:hypothetical protein